MGKAAQWFRGLLGLKKPDSCSPTPAAQKPPKEKRRWSFVKSYKEKDQHQTIKHRDKTEATTRTSYGQVAVQAPEHEDGVVDPNKHAMAVAAATAAVAEAAQAAAQAAAAVVRLTSSGRCTSNTATYAGGSLVGARVEWAAMKIQAAFRGCLVGVPFPLSFACYSVILFSLAKCLFFLYNWPLISIKLRGYQSGSR